MSTIAEKLQTLVNSTAAIKQAIIDKGGTIEGNITTWANAISGLSGGGASCQFLICRCDFPHPMTGAHNYTVAVFDNITNGCTWGNLEGRVDITGNYKFSSIKLPNGNVVISITETDSDTSYGRTDIYLTDVIDTTRLYDFIYG